MLPHLPPTKRLILVVLFCLFGAGQARAATVDDPLKELIDGLKAGSQEPTEVWLDVLSKQPQTTTTTLVQVLREDGDLVLLPLLESQLKGLCAFISDKHMQQAWSPSDWQRYCPISMEIVALFGKATQVHELLILLAPPEHALEGQYDTRRYQHALKQSVLKACDRDALTLRVLQKAYGQQTRALDSQLLRILGDCDSPKTADTLADCLGKRPHFDGIVLTQIASALRKPHLRISEFGLGTVRPMLRDTVVHTRQSAARALGYADDTESIRPLILLLKDPSDSVRNETLRALQRITAMTIEGHPDRWLTWFDEETQWWHQDSANTLETLKRSSQSDVARTLRELASKRLFRRELAPHVMALLSDRRPEVVRLALATLESLRPPLEELAPRLAGLATHPSPVVQADALRILRYLSLSTPHTLPARKSPLPR